eukprot:scaffold647883_cov24-Prasinocladus_malaysianus.AAC.1
MPEILVDGPAAEGVSVFGTQSRLGDGDRVSGLIGLPAVDKARPLSLRFRMPANQGPTEANKQLGLMDDVVQLVLDFVGGMARTRAVVLAILPFAGGNDYSTLLIASYSN